MILKDETVLAIGMLCMTASILVGRFMSFEYVGFGVTDFIEGLFAGVSAVMNVTFLLRRRKSNFSARNTQSIT